MKVAVTQPYLFAYLGYYQLVQAADVFVLYDDVTFIKKGFINRNYILLNGKPQRITVSVPGASQNKLIKNLSFSDDTSKVLKTIKQAYSKAPYFNNVYQIIQDVFSTPDRGIADVCQLSIVKALEYLNINKKIIKSSELKYDRSLPAADRLMAICGTLGASEYLNSIGGQALYSKEYFHKKGFSLQFIRMEKISYNQGDNEFVPNLSMIDVLMWCPKNQVRELLEAYTLE